MITFIIFLLFVVFFWLIPGNLLYKLLKRNDALLFEFVFSLITGISLFFYISVILRFINLPYEILSYIVFVFLSFYYLLRYKKAYIHILEKLSSLKRYIPSLIIIIASCYFLSVLHLTSGYANGAFYVSATRDSLWRLSIIEELIQRFPPDHPGFAYEALKNYHYFYDFIIASTAKITHINSPLLYYYYFSIISSLVFVLGAYLCIRLFTKSILFQNIGVILCVFTGNLSFLLPLISSQYTFFASNNIFMSDQPFDQGFNPFNLLTYGIFLFLIYLFYTWEEKPEWKIPVVFSFILGFLPGVKIYPGFILLGSLSFIIIRLIIARNKYWSLFGLSYVIFAPFYFLIKGASSTSIVFNPLWILRAMIADRDRVNIQELLLKEEHYKATGNYVRIAQIKIEQFLIYFLGNLNTRILAIPWLVKQGLKMKTITYTNQLIITSILISLLIPLLFIQSRGVYDIIQFTPYGLILLSLISIVFIEKTIKKIDGKSRILAAFILLCVILISSITSLHSVKGKIFQVPVEFNKDEVDALMYIKNNSSENDIVLSDVTGDKIELMYVPALSGRRSYLSGKFIVEQTGINSLKRYNTVKFLERIRPMKDEEHVRVSQFIDPKMIIELPFEEKKRLLITSSDLLNQNGQISQESKQILDDYINHTIDPIPTYIYLSGAGLNAVDLLEYLGYQKVYSNNSAAVFKTN